MLSLLGTPPAVLLNLALLSVLLWVSLSIVVAVIIDPLVKFCNSFVVVAVIMVSRVWLGNIVVVNSLAAVSLALKVLVDDEVVVGKAVVNVVSVFVALVVIGVVLVVVLVDLAVVGLTEDIAVIALFVEAISEH